MKQSNLLKYALLRVTAALFLLTTLLAGGLPPRTAQAATYRVAYIYGSDPTLTANQFNSMLSARTVTVDLYSDLAAKTADFSADQAIIIGDDGDAAAGFLSYTNIQNSAKPVVAIGQWGLKFFTLASMPVASGGSVTASAYNVHVADPYAPIWSSPSPVSQINQTLALFNVVAVPVIGLTIPEPIQFTTRIGRLVGDPFDYSLAAEAIGARCYSYWGYRGTADQLTPSGINLFLNMVFGSPCTAGSYTLNAAPATTDPVMDGVMNYGEWSLTPNRLEMDHGFILAMNDNIRLYLLVDVLESVANNTGPNQNDFWVTFDTNNNGLIDPGVDLNYAMPAATHNMRFQHYTAPANWDFLSATTKSSLGPGFDCYTPDNTKVLNINTATFDCAAHQIWEIAIDLKEINALPGQTIHMGLRTYSPLPHFADELPNVFDVDFSNLITLKLAGANIPIPDPNANIAFTTPPIEITQVVQDINNSIPLVADKTTAGRVSVRTTGVNTPQPVLEYLYGERVTVGGPGSADLPGSPLVQLIEAPPNVDRGTLADTANFLLPPSWVSAGGVTFHAEASDYNRHDITSANQALTFQGKATPVYWIIQENYGTANAPDLMAQATIDGFESYVKTVFPVPDATFVQKPWTVLGALNGMSLSDNVNAVENYYSSISAVYWSAVMQNKQPPFALPDLIFGAGNFGGGLSDPTWFNNSPGHAAVGGSASSAEGVVGHEFNHDLDRSSNGTWGRHVGACSASGPDPNWPGGSNPAITEYGFDTRLPWQNTAGNKTVVPPTTPDLMSYCQSGFLPTKWVGPYRYQAWFGSGAFPAGPSQVFAPAVTPVNTLDVTGSVSTGGTGTLNPVLFTPGIPITSSAAGGYSLVITYPGGTLTHAFDVIFQDDEGGPLTTVNFNFTLPDPGPTPGSVTGIQLFHGATLLATLAKSSNLPSAAFTYPTGGETFTGTRVVTWNLTPGTTPAAGLRQELQYSADNGSTWTAVATNLPGSATSYALDTNLLPMSAQGKLRLWISDGLNNITVDSSGTFTTPNHPPTADILAPFNGGYIPGGTQTLLQGQATDVDETSPLPDSNFQWTLDGTTNLGEGSSLQVVLPNGVHTLTLTVLDRNGATGSASVTIYVNQVRFYLPVLHR